MYLSLIPTMISRAKNDMRQLQTRKKTLRFNCLMGYLLNIAWMGNTKTNLLT